MAAAGNTGEVVDEFTRSSDPITLTRFLLQERSRFSKATGNFTMLLQSIQLACKSISNSVKRAGIAGLYGVYGGSNSSGDEQKKLDVLANDCFINCLTFSQQVYLMVSEENDHPIVCDNKHGGYAIVFDPLDGSSNIDANISVGTIFGIYKKDDSSSGKGVVGEVLKAGSELVAAGYALYGSATMMVLTTGLGVNGFTLDPSLGEFILTHPNIRIPKKGKVYSINEGNSAYWDQPIREYIAECKKANTTKKPKSARYVGSMVADVHRTLLYGGIFLYPADAQSKNGKLRLLYECNPMAFIVEQAGGRATSGTERILDVQPTSIHQRYPIIMGSTDDVLEVEALYAKHKTVKAKL